MLKKIISIIFILFILGMFILNLFSKDTIISISERRKLATFPDISSIADGKFANKFDKYVTDQFIFRDEFRKIKSFVELRILGKKDVNNLFIQDGSIIKLEYPLNEKSVYNVCNKINQIKELYLNDSNKIYFSIVPDKNYFSDDSYLKIDYKEIEDIMCNNLKNVKYINIMNELSLDDYYLSDIHWKQESITKILPVFEASMNCSVSKEFEEKEYGDFYGVYSGQLQYNRSTDKIKVLTNNVIENCKTYNYETKKYGKIYNFDKLDGLDKYDIFLDGAVSLIRIENPNFSGNKRLIIFRDSFASSLVPLLSEAYNEIILVDIRYISSRYLNDINFENSDILFLYSTSIINNSGVLK